MNPPELVVLRNFSRRGQARMEVVSPDNARLEVYRAHGGYQAAEKALTSLRPEEVIALVKASGLRGRGGAGFPTGAKWGFIPRDGRDHYLVINGDEGEPGTFKDRYLLEFDPHALIEGALIAAYAVGARRAYLYVRGEYARQIAAVEQAVAEAYEAKLLGAPLFGTGFSLDFTVARGAGAYICGEETALLESLEGRRGHPRLKPPFPALCGLYGMPTVVNNVETICTLPPILDKGPQWYAGLGTPASGGTRLVTVSGHVKHPGVYEVPLSTTLSHIVHDLCGGPSRIHPDTGEPVPVKAVIPGGLSAPALTAAELDTPICYDSLAKACTMAGSGGIIVMDQGVCMVEVAETIMHFYAHESCGQCTPCREGAHFLLETVRNFLEGRGEPRHLELIRQVTRFMKGTTICALSEAAALPMETLVNKFQDDFTAHIDAATCPLEDFNRRLALKAATWPVFSHHPLRRSPWPRS